MNGEKRFLPFPVAWHASSPPSKKRDFFAPRRRPAAFRFFIFLCLLKFTFKGGVLYCSSFDIFHLPRRRVTVHKNRLDTLLGQREPHHVDEDELTMGAVSLHRESQNRRKALFTIASCIMVPSCVNAASSDSLVDLELGRGQWSKLDRNAGSMAAPTTKLVNPSFCTYATRFLIHYDEGFASWWSSVVYKYSLLPADERLSKLGQAFGSLARSVQIGTGDFLAAQRQPKDGIVQLYDLFKDKYGEKDDADRQIALLFSLLDDDLQPTEKLRQAATVTIPASQSNPVADITVSSLLNEEASMLLPERYHCAKVQDSALFTIDPPIALFEIGIDEEFGQTATATAFGPLAYSPLTREIPVYSPEMYALFGISGAAGCAITHSFVIPLDVVKTRNQVDPEQYSDFFGSAVSIFKNEGMKGLLLGAQATVAGYFWYGCSVYPSYTFFKRALSLSILPADIATVHADDIALLAGALAAVVASLGLTPLEAARIRVVAEPEQYQDLGLTGTLGVIAGEGERALGLDSLYAGLPSLLARQVIFGSVKFLAFERACDLIFSTFPALRDATWTSLLVSLVAGGFSGALSSIVSQPADSVLTYVAQNSDGSSSNLGFIQGFRAMIEKEGIQSLFRGLGSRCIWAGSIIAGQFLLYDVFRTFFCVNSADLTQVYQIVLPAAV